MRHLLILIPLALALGCGRSGPGPEGNPAPPAKDNHDHGKEGPHGGPLAEWGDHEYHVEFTVDRVAGMATVYLLDGEAKASRPIAASQLTLTLKLTPPVSITLRPAPQPGDPAGTVSAFAGSHEALKQKPEFVGAVSGQVAAKKYSGDFKETAHAGHVPQTPSDPSGQPTQREKDLFLKPGGIYTQADIEKNGSTVPSVKYRGVAFDHDDNLKPGDKICPVTVNKADEKCNWWVNGKQYQFCCPPCLEKFVKQAKESPEKIKDPSEYIKK